MKLGKSEMSAATGMDADGCIIRDNEQARKVRASNSFALAALLLSEGLKDEAHQTAWGIHHVIYETKGYVSHSGSQGRHRRFPSSHSYASRGGMSYGDNQPDIPLAMTV